MPVIQVYVSREIFDSVEKEADAVGLSPPKYVAYLLESNPAWQVSKGRTPFEKTVLEVYLCFAEHTGKRALHEQEIRARTGLSGIKVRSALQHLKDAGVLYHLPPRKNDVQHLLEYALAYGAPVPGEPLPERFNGGVGDDEDLQAKKEEEGLYAAMTEAQNAWFKDRYGMTPEEADARDLASYQATQKHEGVPS